MQRFIWKRKQFLAWQLTKWKLWVLVSWFIASYTDTSIILTLLIGKLGKKKESIHWKIIHTGDLIPRRWNSHLAEILSSLLYHLFDI